jgi:hypothetical protein
MSGSLTSARASVQPPFHAPGQRLDARVALAAEAREVEQIGHARADHGGPMPK